MKKDKKKILIVLALVFIICVIVGIRLLKARAEETNKENIVDINLITEETLINNEKENKASMLKYSNERERMQSYFSSFIEMIEAKQYEQAYALLYDEFKTNYFPTEALFKEYCEEKFIFQMFDVTYTNIERNGDIYILWIQINDPVGDGETMNLNAVIKENDFNDYVLSFSV